MSKALTNALERTQTDLRRTFQTPSMQLWLAKYPTAESHLQNAFLSLEAAIKSLK